MKAISYANELEDQYYCARAYSIIAVNNIILENDKEFTESYEIAEKIFKSLNQYEDLVRLNTKIAVYMFRKGMIEKEILFYLEKCLNDIGKFQSARSAQLYITIGSAYSLIFSDFDIAIDLFLKALDISKYYNDISMEVLILYYIAIGYVDMRMINEAIKLFTNILEDERFYKFTSTRIAAAYDFIKLLLNNGIKLELIEKLLIESEEEIKKLDFLKYEQYMMQLNLLKVEYNIEIKNENIKESLEILDKSNEVYKRHRENCIFTYIDYYIEQLYGDACYKLGKFLDAIKHHDNALKISQRYKTKHTIKAYERLAKDYETLGDYKNAYEYIKELNKLIINVEHSRLMTKYSNVQKNYERLKWVEKEREEFFANLSHELKTPINIIYSSTQLMNLFKNKSDKSFKEYYLKHEKSVRINCLRMLKIVQNMIDINKIDCGAITPNFTNYNLVNLIEEITLSVLSSVEIKDINIIFDTQEEEIYVKCDPYMIERIILNLLSNAIKFSKEKGNILVNIYKENSYVVIKVEDDGIGIPVHMKENIFNKFVQIDKTFKRKNEGSGIGLSLVKSLVEIHNGYIELDSIEGLGSSFKIFIPNIELKNKEEDYIKGSYDIDIERVIGELSDIYNLY